MIYIKFKNKEDTAKGFYELITKTSVRAFPNGIYGIAEENLAILDEDGVAYEIVSKKEAISEKKTPTKV